MPELSEIEQLKFNLQETQFPYFSDPDLQTLLKMYPGVARASYEGCLIKSSNDSVALGPINTPNNEQYWVRRAKHFRQLWISEQRKEKLNSSGDSSQMSWKRVDE